MAAITPPARPGPLHHFHAAMLAGVAPLFVGALLADWAYARSYQIEWSNFASWLLIGAMVLATRGRPVGVAVDPHGALIVADDLSNTIWRIAPGP